MINALLVISTKIIIREIFLTEVVNEMKVKVETKQSSQRRWFGEGSV